VATTRHHATMVATIRRRATALPAPITGAATVEEATVEEAAAAEVTMAADAATEAIVAQAGAAEVMVAGAAAVVAAGAAMGAVRVAGEAIARVVAAATTIIPTRSQAPSCDKGMGERATEEVPSPSFHPAPGHRYHTPLSLPVILRATAAAEARGGRRLNRRVAGTFPRKAVCASCRV
jgi:hypothetical protein